MSAQPLDVNEFLLSGGVPAAKFETPGTSCTGKITFLKVEQQREIDSGKPKYWDDGTPQMQIVCHVQTSMRDPQIPDDDGMRALYIRNNMKAAVGAAVRKVRAKLTAGGILTVTYTGDGERKSAAYNPPKLYAAEYAPPSVAAVDDVLGVTPDPAAEPAALPPGITAEQWADLPQAAKEAMAKMHNLPPY
jgi:hypothetical protein